MLTAQLCTTNNKGIFIFQWVSNFFTTQLLKRYIVLDMKAAVKAVVKVVRQKMVFLSSLLSMWLCCKNKLGANFILDK